MSSRSLVEWKRALRPVLLGQPGVVYLDADEARNRCDRRHRRRPVPRASTPAASTRRSRCKGCRARRSSTRRSPAIQRPRRGRRWPPPRSRGRTASPSCGTFRPAPGGVQITFLDLPLAYSAPLGFNAYLGGAFGFVTNSHCTRSRGDGRRHPLCPGERHLRPPRSPPRSRTRRTSPAPACPSGRQCRYSDSSFAQYNGSSTSLGSFRELARTSSRGARRARSTLKPGSSPVHDHRHRAPALEGQTVNKIGVTTGWTYGPVTATCADPRRHRHHLRDALPEHREGGLRPRRQRLAGVLLDQPATTSSCSASSGAAARPTGSWSSSTARSTNIEEELGRCG